MVILNNKKLVRDIVAGKTVGEATMDNDVTSQGSSNAPQAASNGQHILAKLYEGKKVFIRTVTHHHVGEFVMVADGFIILTKASWVAVDGRFANTLAKGELEEVEPFPPDLLIPVSIASFIDCCEWLHDLPNKQK
jgi:hypothetical protein